MYMHTEHMLAASHTACLLVHRTHPGPAHAHGRRTQSLRHTGTRVPNRARQAHAPHAGKRGGHLLKALALAEDDRSRQRRQHDFDLT